jgi:rubrerythrin
VTAAAELHLDEGLSAPSRTLVCAECGYGIVRPVPPERCPMCQDTVAWVPAEPRSARTDAGAVA